MKRVKAIQAAGAGALALMLATPMFAQSRNEGRRDDNRRVETTRSSSSRTYRNNERVTVTGKVTSFSRERDGYRVYLDRGRDAYWVPQSYFGGNRGRDLRVGVSIALGGVFRSGSIYVDAVNWPDDRGGYYGSSNGYVAGYVDRVDYRRGIIDLRDDRTGRFLQVDVRDRRGRLTIDDINRGDYVQMSGAWSGGGVFDAYSIDSVSNGRR